MYKIEKNFSIVNIEFTVFEIKKPRQRLAKLDYFAGDILWNNNNNHFELQDLIKNISVCLINSFKACMMTYFHTSKSSHFPSRNYASFKTKLKIQTWLMSLNWTRFLYKGNHKFTHLALRLQF